MLDHFLLLSGDEPDEVDDSELDPDFIPEDNSTESEEEDGDIPDYGTVPVVPDRPEQPGQSGAVAGDVSNHLHNNK